MQPNSLTLQDAKVPPHVVQEGYAVQVLELSRWDQRPHWQVCVARAFGWPQNNFPDGQSRSGGALSALLSQESAACLQVRSGKILFCISQRHLERGQEDLF